MNAFSDLDRALDLLAETDPTIRQRYARDPTVRAEVAEFDRRARELANDTTDVKRHRILQAPGARTRYESDAEFRADVEVCAIAAAIHALKNEPPS